MKHSDLGHGCGGRTCPFSLQMAAGAAFAVVVVCGGLATAHAAPVVAGYERFGRAASSPEATVEAGLLLVGELGCTNCHAATTQAQTHLLAKPAPMLDALGERIRHEWLAGYIADPHAAKPGTTMPSMLAALPKTERAATAEAIAQYLSTTGNPNEAEPRGFAQSRAASGAEIYERTGCAACHGSLTESAPRLPDQVPLGQLAAKWTLGGLEAFLANPLASRPAGRMPRPSLDPRERLHLLKALLGDPRPPVQASQIDPVVVASGKKAFTAMGCANCHSLSGHDAERGMVAGNPPPLVSLAGEEGGCLSPDSNRRATGSAWYGLDDKQREAITAAIDRLAAGVIVTPPRERAIDRAFTALNCYACHERDGKGGSLPATPVVDDDGEPVLRDPARDAVFTSAVAELGDEGRLPPSLSDVGDRLQSAFLLEVMAKGGRDRAKYMHTRMPSWPAAEAERLRGLLAGDAHTVREIPELSRFKAEEVTEQGRHLVGSQALGCIKCHSFNQIKGQSLGVIDMVRMPKRLRHEWFLAYVANPQQFRPGTKMPASWPEEKTFYPDILDGTAVGQIESVWRFISSQRPKPPVGTASNPIELVPNDRPIIYRNFIDGAGPRAVGVGYPEKTHLAWDAEQMRLALVWRGAFIDAGRHWSGRSIGWQPPLGDAVFKPDAAVPLAVLADPEDPWPTTPPRESGARFLGYVFDEAGRPSFSWSNGGIRVREHFTPDSTGNVKVIRRSLRLEGKPPEGVVVFRAAAPQQSLADEADGWRRVDGLWRLRVTQGVGEGVAPATSAPFELRYPVQWNADGTAEIIEELSW